MLGAGEITVSLPAGLYAGGERHRATVLGPLTGSEDELLKFNAQALRSTLCTALLGRCIKRIGSFAPVTEAMVRDLLVADRIYALLMLRTTMFGPHIQAVVVCPHAGCHAKMNIDFEATDIQITPLEHPAASHILTLAASAGHPSLEIDLRLPNGGDQEAIEPMLRAGEDEAAVRRLLARCVLRLGPEQPDDAAIGNLDPLVRGEIEARLHTLAPSVEFTVEGECAACGRLFSLPFDLTDFVLRELAFGAATVHSEVHFLAFHYHWSEAEILRLPRTKRRMYIDLLSARMETAAYA